MRTSRQIPTYPAFLPAILMVIQAIEYVLSDPQRTATFELMVSSLTPCEICKTTEHSLPQNRLEDFHRPSSVFLRAMSVRCLDDVPKCALNGSPGRKNESIRIQEVAM